MLSINTRIVTSASAVLFIFIAATGLALDRAFLDSARSAREERLLGQVYLLIAAAEVNSQGTVSMPVTFSEARFSLPGSGLYGAIIDSTGSPVWRSPSALGIELPAPTTSTAGEERFGQRQDQSGRSFFVYGLGVKWAAGKKHFPFTFAVTEDLTEFNAQLDRYRGNLWGWLGAMALLLLVAQALVLRWSLRPLRSVAQELSAIESGHQKQLEGQYPREIKNLSENLNALIKREHARQKRYRDALADLAHSLKTPLAVIRATLSSNEERPILSAIVDEQAVQMKRIIEYQLQRAATAGRSTGLAARLPIRPVAERIIASLNKVYRDKQVTTMIDADEHANFRGDQDDLTEVLGNLTDNAYKWCVNRVQVSIRTDNNRLTIKVEDNGPGIRPDEVQRILERGVRADENVPGHGIGLAIVRDIVASYEGEIVIDKSELGGAAIRIHIPNH